MHDTQTSLEDTQRLIVATNAELGAAASEGAMCESRAKLARCSVAEGSASSVYEALTLQALRMMHEVFAGGGISQATFVQIYLAGLGDYERRIARKNQIKIPRQFHRKPNKEGSREAR